MGVISGLLGGTQIAFKYFIKQNSIDIEICVLFSFFYVLLLTW